MDVFDTTAVSAVIDADLLPTVPGSHERSDLLGGKVRDAVPFTAYLFCKWAEHPAPDGRAPIGDAWARPWTRPGSWSRRGSCNSGTASGRSS